MSQNPSFRRLNICLFSFSEYSEKYKELLNNFRVRVVDIEKEEYCRVLMESIKCSGMLLDISSYLKSSMDTKTFVSNLGKIYPAARIRYNTETENMELMLLNDTKKISLKEFLESHCSNFKARKLRQHGRVPINLNISILPEEGEPEKILCTSTNISANGLFVLNKTEQLPMDAKVKIQILELGKDHFIHGTVVRSLAWGEKLFHASGFGIRIEDIDEEIFDDYARLVKMR